MDSLKNVDKTMEMVDNDNYDLKTDIGYKFLLNWCLKKIAESFMTDHPLAYISLERIYSRLEFMINFFPYFGTPETLKDKIKITASNGKEYSGFFALKLADKTQRISYYYGMLEVLRSIMKVMDDKKLLLQSYATFVFGYDGDLVDDT